MNNFICVPIPAELYNELVLRVGSPEKDVTGFIEYAVENYLNRTDDDGWSDAYYDWKDKVFSTTELTEKYGDPQKGYSWGNVLFLPNGTKVSMKYQGKNYHAEIIHEQLIYEDKPCSPSKWARKIAKNTSRNAWRDLWIRRPSDAKWYLADELRRKA